ncbi:MAG: hypothetical protein K2F88_01745, partial [Duncaniella sp.]|nr:hypothetical protein [Duncaniella sp.]
QFSKRDTKAKVTLKILRYEIIKREKYNTVAQILTIVFKQPLKLEDQISVNNKLFINYVKCIKQVLII